MGSPFCRPVPVPRVVDSFCLLTLGEPPAIGAAEGLNLPRCPDMVLIIGGP